MLEETSNDYDNMSILTFPRLRVLRTLEPMILKVLQTPTLEQLYIDDSTSFLELEPVPPFLDRSKCALQNLYIGHLKLESSGAFPAILQRSPDIKSLTIRLLTCRPNMPSLAPKLKALTIVFPDNSTNDIDGFTAMVASRTAERLSFVEQLQRVTVVLDSRKTIPDIFQQICEEHAVNFNFVYHDCWNIKGNDPIWGLEDDDIKWST
ncbi:hypothetical protein F5887DRAFT_971288 [Amanita rubescens]|nr:hypothetical protein F5887DRAFT_971288 [Amanita rubescens]